MLGDAAVVQDRLGDIIRLGGRAEDGGWQNIRAMGKVNEWQPQGEAGLMVVEGAGTVSAGYRFNLPSALEASFKTLKLRISGNAPAQYYINIYNGQGKEVVATGWTDSPSEEREVSLAIPGDGTVPAVPVFPADQVTWFSPETEKERIEMQNCTSQACIVTGRKYCIQLEVLRDINRILDTKYTDKRSQKPL